MKIYESVLDLIGGTPLLELKSLESEKGVCARIAAKVESFNPAGSAKDRVAKEMIEDAEARGILRDGSVIVEPTSGNTGIGLAQAAAARGYRVILTMPETMSVERRNLLAAYGAELVLTDGTKGMSGAIEKAEEIAKNTPNCFLAGQFTNPANPAAHYKTTGPEIWKDTDGTVELFVAGVGTGGTLTGVGRYLKEQNPKIRVIAAEPSGSPVLSGGKAGAHGLQGIGAGFIPEVLDTEIYDEVIAVSDEDAMQMGNRIAKQEGILVGISAGAAAFAALVLAKCPENAGKLIVVLLPDSGERYLSTGMFR